MGLPLAEVWVGHLVDRAIRTALSERRATAVVLPTTVHRRH